MFAIIETGGKQYKVAEGDIIRVELLDAEVDSTIDIGKVLVFRYKPKKNERTKNGHRQPFTKLEIVSINA